MDTADYIASVVIPAISALGGWFVGRRKRRADVESAELQNVQATLNIYIQMIGDMKKHIDNLESRVNDLLTENTKLRKDLQTAQENNNKMRKRIEALEAQLKAQQ